MNVGRLAEAVTATRPLTTIETSRRVLVFMVNDKIGPPKPEVLPADFVAWKPIPCWPSPAQIEARHTAERLQTSGA